MGGGVTATFVYPNRLTALSTGMWFGNSVSPKLVSQLQGRFNLHELIP